MYNLLSSCFMSDAMHTHSRQERQTACFSGLRDPAGLPGASSAILGFPPPTLAHLAPSASASLVLVSSQVIWNAFLGIPHGSVMPPARLLWPLRVLTYFIGSCDDLLCNPNRYQERGMEGGISDGTTHSRMGRLCLILASKASYPGTGFIHPYIRSFTKWVLNTYYVTGMVLPLVYNSDPRWQTALTLTLRTSRWPSEHAQKPENSPRPDT